MNGKKVRLKNKFATFSSILNYKLFNKKCPLIVSWTLTNRCNKKCLYCNLPNIKSNELTTKDIFAIIDELKKNGTKRIGFTGGEPLLRKDIGKIINYCKKKEIFVGVVSNGSLVNEKINELRNLDLLQLSIDGIEKTNDGQRYSASYIYVISAISAAKKNNIMVWLTYTITKNNANKKNYEHILNLAKEFSLNVFFQPVVDYENCGLKAKELLPNEVKYKNMVRHLIKIKNNNNKEIGNSLMGLKCLYQWPNLNNSKIKCYAGKLMAHIYPDGSVYPCFNLIYYKTLNAKNGFMQAFNGKSNKTQKCPGCWTYASIEFNALLSLNINSVLNTIKLLK